MNNNEKTMKSNVYFHDQTHDNLVVCGLTEREHRSKCCSHHINVLAEDLVEL